MSRIRVAVLMGGRSAEREVSLSTGKQVLQALEGDRYEAFPVDTGSTASLSRLCVSAADPAERPDVAFLCLHGQYGEDGTIQGMLELLEIPYTGSGVLASALAMSKVMSKKIYGVEGIRTPRDVTLRSAADAEAFLRAFHAGAASVGCPAVVKPSEQGSTIGITIVREPEDMARAVETALSYDDEVLVEEFIDGIEITGPVLGNETPECLPLVEIVPAGGFYDYEAKYTPGATDEIVPARLTAEQTREAQELAVRAHKALGCRGCSRTDMLVADNGVWVLETNTIPGMTPTSLLPRSAEAAGLPFPQLVDRLIQLALEGRSREPTPAARS